MKKVAVILCGCGSMDGSEIHESTFALLAIDELGAEYECFSFDKPQARVMNFLTAEEETAETRNQLKESARIARGKVKKIQEAKASEFDALIIPGGFGAAFNLCTFAKEQSKGSVEPELADLIKDFQSAKKPIGAICISPSIIALVLGKTINPKLTAGEANDPIVPELESLGCEVVPCQTSDCIIDEKNKIVSTPAYMNAKRISDVRKGIQKCVEAVLKMS